MISKNPLGQTELNVSKIGLGTVKFGRNQGMKYPSSFELPSDKEIKHLIAIAKEMGVNLLDTAPAYGLSEERLGKALNAHYRPDWIIASKVGEEFIKGQSLFDFSKEHINLSVERSLKRLKTDYLDIVLVHSDGNDLERIDNDLVFESLATLKKRGLIRYFGMSSKTIDGGIKTIEQSDLAMVTFNPLEQDEKAVIDRALELNKGIFIKKAFVSGHLDKIAETNPIEEALRLVLQTPGVSSLITGTINPKHLQETLAFAATLSP